MGAMVFYEFRNRVVPGLMLLFSLFFAVRSKAQETASFFLLPGVSQNLLLNPAFQNENDKLIIGFPLLSGIYGSWSANVPLNALFTEGFSYSFHRFYDKLEPRGELNASAEITLFYASLKSNSHTFSLSVSERMFSTADFDRNLVKLIRDGTKDYYGSAEDFGTGTFHFQQFRELAFGFSKVVWDELQLGLRTKILFGKLFFDTRDLRFSVATDTLKKELQVKPEGSFVFSGPFSHERDQVLEFSRFSANVLPGDYFFQPRNLGLAVDLGAVIIPARFYEIAFSLLDFGFTGYRYNTFDVDFSGPSRFSANTLYQSHSPGQEHYMEPREALRSFGDSVSYIIDVAEAGTPSLMLLPFKINFSGKYHFSEAMSAGVSNHFIWFRNQARNLFSVFCTTTLNERTTLSGSLSLYPYSTVQPGLGLTYTLKNFQFFFASNNISGIIQPAASKHLNLSLGMNLLFDTQK